MKRVPEVPRDPVGVSRVKREPDRTARRPYQPPVLTRWGSIEELTQGGNGHNPEGGGPGGGPRTRLP